MMKTYVRWERKVKKRKRREEKIWACKFPFINGEDDDDNDDEKKKNSNNKLRWWRGGWVDDDDDDDEDEEVETRCQNCCQILR